MDRFSTAIFWSEADRVFLATVHELPGCIADGSTPEEAARNVAEVARQWVATARELGRTMPAPVTLEVWQRQQQDSRQRAKRQFLKAAAQPSR
jgi:predicted RNase H-like HicB family nuclease